MIQYDLADIRKATSTKEKNSKRGRCTQQRAMVAVIAESNVLEDFKAGELTKNCRYFKRRR